jgi:hypothetical protein
MVIALACAGILVLSNLPYVSDRFHASLSSIPLAIAGIGYGIAATFMIWAIDQLLPSEQLATLIGDVVIAAYVLDLFWLTQDQELAAKAPSDSDH